MIVAAIFTLIGGLFRRWWGGWLNTAPHLVKLALGFVLAFAAGFVCLDFVTSALAFAVPVGLSFINPFHSKFMRMGRPSPPNPNPGLKTCILGMGLTYSAYALAGGVAAAFCEQSLWPLLFAPVGFPIALGYAFAWWLNDRFKVFPIGKTGSSYFLDGPTALGEVFLGMAMIGGLPVIAAVL